MTQHFILAKDSDQAQWNEFVLSHPDATPYHLFAWGQAVERAYGFKKHYWLMYENEQLCAIMPGVYMRTLVGKITLCSLPYCDIGGVLAISEEHKQALLAHLHQHYAHPQLGCKSIEVREANNTLLALNEAVEGEKVRMLLSLPESADELMAQFKSKLRSQIRKAEKNGLSFRIVSHSPSNLDKQALDDFYAVIAENMRLLGSPVHSKKWYKEILSSYGEQAYLALVEFEGIVVGAALVITTHNKAVIPWASTRADYNRLAPNMLLYWAVLGEATTRGMQEFDFGRSTVGEGTYNFKKQWGCLPQALNWQVYKNGSIQVAEHIKTSPARELVENVWRKLPLSVTNTLGPKVRKYISL